MEAILLAGGLGTRLKSVVADRPKPMADINGKPFLFYLLNYLSRCGVDRLVFAVGYKGSMVEEYFGDGSGLLLPTGRPMSIRYAYEKELLGTAGAIKNALSAAEEPAFFVLNADTYCEADLPALASCAASLGAPMAISLRRVADTARYGAAVMSDGRLTSFNEKGRAGEGVINGGIYYMERKLAEKIPDGRVSLENDMIPLWLSLGILLAAREDSGYFVDIGIPEDYFRFCREAGKIAGI